MVDEGLYESFRLASRWSVGAHRDVPSLIVRPSWWWVVNPLYPPVLGDFKNLGDTPSSPGRKYPAPSGFAICPRCYAAMPMYVYLCSIYCGVSLYRRRIVPQNRMLDTAFVFCLFYLLSRSIVFHNSRKLQLSSECLLASDVIVPYYTQNSFAAQATWRVENLLRMCSIRASFVPARGGMPPVALPEPNVIARSVATRQSRYVCGMT